jgi:3-methyladenine DNA glycosylase AlkC
MAELLKDFLSPTFVGEVAQLFQETHPGFPSEAYVRLALADPWPSLELKPRFRQMAEALRQTLPDDVAEAMEAVAAVADRLVARQGENLSFVYMFMPEFVALYGVEHPDKAIAALERITRWSSAEFAVRPFLARYPERMYGQMLAWSTHPSAMVRRLSSEGFRPRLPWGMGIPTLKKDPSPILPVLENLKADPAETVRRSVANNLNDISKDHPDLALSIASRWQGASAETDWVVKHALRGLLRKGKAEALARFGFEQERISDIQATLTPASTTVKISESLTFIARVHNQGDSPRRVRLEYAINYLTSSGKTTRKVFFIKTADMASGEEATIQKRQRFTDFTTRKHYPGQHQLALLVNGITVAEATFDVVRP